MGNIRLYGSTSGYTELAPPAVAPDGVLSLPTGTGTIAKTTDQGLVHINTTTFSAVSSVSVDDCFTSDYQNYVAILVLSASGVGNHHLRLRVSGVDDTSSNYIAQIIYMSGTTNSAVRETNTFMPVAYSGTTASTTINLYSPAIATPTRIWAPAQGSDGADTSPFIYFRSGLHNVSTAYDGLTITAASGTITGTLRIYGYKNGA